MTFIPIDCYIPVFVISKVKPPTHFRTDRPGSQGMLKAGGGALGPKASPFCLKMCHGKLGNAIANLEPTLRSIPHIKWWLYPHYR